ncbi:SMR family transporter [Salibacterium sp. K-3]
MLEITTSYAVWSGVTIAAATLIGIAFFRETTAFAKDIVHCTHNYWGAASSSVKLKGTISG